MKIEIFFKKTHTEGNIDADDLFLEDILSLRFFLSPRPLIKTGAKLRARSLGITKKTEKTTLVSSGEDAKTTLVSSGELKYFKNGSYRSVDY